MHDFFGNTTTDANSTAASLHAGGTTCSTADDTSGYWEPTMYFHDVIRHAVRVSVYYVGNGNTIPVPDGLQMIAGNAHATSPPPVGIVNWSCGENTPKSTRPYDCTPYLSEHPNGVTAMVKFPSCWDADGVTRDHVVYRSRGACPEGFRN